MCNKDCYVGLHNHSYYSLLDGLPSPTKIAQRAKEIGSPAIATTDHGNIFGMVEFHNACKKNDIKPIQGIELYICQQDPSIRNNDNKHHNHLTILAKNQEGIKELMALVSATNKPDWFYRKPRIDLANLSLFTKNKNLICLSGCLIGELSESLFADFNAACLFGADLNRLEDCRKLLKPNWKDNSLKIIEKYKIFKI
jgi:DNA polymerase-3 subunit alpha